MTDVDEWAFVPKVSEEVETTILKKLGKMDTTLGEYMTNKNENEVIYHSVGRYWLKAFNFVPVFNNEKSGVTRSTKYKSIYFKRELDRMKKIYIISDTRQFTFS